LFGGSGSGHRQDVEESIEQLYGVLRETVDPGSWHENGGFYAMREINGVLVVDQSWANHRHIAAVLDSIRRSVADPKLPASPHMAVPQTAPTSSSAGARPVLRSYNLIWLNACRPTASTAARDSEAVDAVKTLIERTIDANSWRSSGGGPGAINTIGYILIVEQTPENQSRVAALLGRLKAQSDATPPQTRRE
jgi:hypothetical protein